MCHNGCRIIHCRVECYIPKYHCCLNNRKCPRVRSTNSRYVL